MLGFIWTGKNRKGEGMRGKSVLFLLFLGFPLALSPSQMANTVRPQRTASASSCSATHTSTRRVLSTGIPLLSLGPTRVDVLPVGSILHQWDVVVSGEREVGDAAHQPPQVLPVRVQGNFLHATCGKGSQKLHQHGHLPLLGRLHIQQCHS